MPWRNGRGETREVAASPAGATLETFDWRVSVATVARSGPFSHFPGVARTLVLLSGAGVRLGFAATRIELTQPYAAATLRGDDDVECELVGSAVEMFNVMVRRATTARIVLCERGGAVPAGDVRVCYAADDDMSCEVGGLRFELARGEALVLDGGADRASELRIRPGRPGGVLLTAVIETVGPA
jgi:environmental stress-induced protein Ves